MVKIDNVLLLTDFSDDAKHAMEYARAMAERFGSKLYVLHVIGDPTNRRLYGKVEGDYLAMEINARQKAREEMAKYGDLLADFPNHELLVVQGGVLVRVLETIEGKHIDTLVMGSQGGGVLRNLLTGSIADKVTRGVTCNVWTIRRPDQAAQS